MEPITESIVKSLKTGQRRLRNRYYLNSQFQACPTPQKGDRDEPRRSNLHKSVFAQEGGKDISAKDLKLDLTTAKKRGTRESAEKIRGPNFYQDPRFAKILEEKRKLQRLKLKNREKELARSQLVERKEIEIREKSEQQQIRERQERASTKLQELRDRRREREEVLKSSLSYKFLKNQVPLFKQIERSRIEQGKPKAKAPARNRRMPLEDLLSHSKMFQTKQSEKQREREIRKKREKQKTKSLYHILDKLNRLDNKLGDMRELRMAKLRDQKERVRNYSLQVLYFLTLRSASTLWRSPSSRGPSSRSPRRRPSLVRPRPSRSATASGRGTSRKSAT